ncbi:hypothetical protein [Nodularia chucula]|uniref:hypothetical protein n=1 Tax=Nodularia chucula TaxID=3093667 RepID=UPI0039C73056
MDATAGITTFAPFAASAIAVASLIPAEALVIIATLPSNFPIHVTSIKHFFIRDPGGNRLEIAESPN